jgi:tRNA modification GTPase
VASLVVEGETAIDAVSQHFQAASGQPLRKAADNRILFGRWSRGEGAGEELVVSRRTDQRIEIHCHGGRLAAETILEDLARLGCRQVPWDVRLRFPAAGAAVGVIAAEAARDLAAARTERTAALLLDQHQGALERECEAIADLVSQGNGEPARRRLETLDRYSAAGLHAAAPWRVLFAGPPNVGKSSLMNAVLGYPRSIAYDQPGTTRDVLTATTALDGWPVEFADTAGLRSTTDVLEFAGAAAARRRLTTADLVVLVFDTSLPWLPEHDALLRATPTPLVVHNKCDLVHSGFPPEAQAGAPHYAERRPAGLAVSALTHEGIDRLLQHVRERLVPDPPPPGAAVPFTTRQVRLLRQARFLLAADEAKAAQLLRTVNDAAEGRPGD